MSSKMDHRKLHPQIRAGIYRARAGQHQQEDIAKVIGTTPQNLSNFMQGASIGPEFTQKAKKWLAEHGYWDPAATPFEQASTDPMDAIALTVERMLPSIKSSSGLPLEVRAKFFKRVMAAVDEELYPIAQAYASAAEAKSEYSPTPDSDSPD